MPKTSVRAAPVDASERARRDLILRLKRIEGQLRGVQQMIEAGSDCEAVAQQMTAARKALDKAFYEMLACAIEHPALAGGPAQSDAARANRIARLIAKFA